MSVTTPSTGQKISDFSAGSVDANSYFIQANSGSTSKVTATQIGQYSNLNLLFSGTGGLDTTNKTIVGAINEVNSKDIEDIDDVNITSVADGDALIYDSTSSKWVNTSLNSATSPLFYWKNYTCTQTSVAANTSVTMSKTDFSITDVTGYTPLAVRKIGVSKAGFNIISFNVSGVSSVLSVSNNTSAAIANATFTIDIIYVKSNFLQNLT